MAKKAISILSDHNTLRSFKQNAYNVASKFDINQIVPMYEDLYAELLEKSTKKVEN